MNYNQLERIRHGSGFIAALDHGGGSTPAALASYGIPSAQYHGSEEMFALVHAMRTRIITSTVFDGDKIIGAILFSDTMHRLVDGMPAGQYLWKVKDIVPFVKIDQGLDEERHGAQCMRPIAEFTGILKSALDHRMFGTKMRSVIHEADKKGIAAVAEQQFDYARKIIAVGLVPILEMEVDIHAADRPEAERLLKLEMVRHLATLDKDAQVIFKLSIPVQDDYYADLMHAPHVLRVAGLSGGYSRERALLKLARNHGMVASFSRALLSGLSITQSDEEFNRVLRETIDAIYAASVT